MRPMHKRARLEATFGGEPVDRAPVALWRHWPGDDQRADDLAAAQLAFQDRYDWDFIKVTPSSAYCVEDWGVITRYEGTTEGTRSYLQRRIHVPEDWANLESLNPKQGALGRQIRCLELIGHSVRDQVPFIQTIFNPLSVARYLAGDETLLVHLRQFPDALHEGLRTITRTTCDLVSQVMRTGAAGVFLAVQHAQYGILSAEEYARFGRPYDLQVLQATEGAWFNLLHLHGRNVMFDELADYPVQAINWHDRETPPTLSAGAERFDGALVGGLRQWETIVRGSPDDVKSEADEAIAQTAGRRFILGTGCVTPIVAPTSNLKAARQAVEVA